MDGANQVAVGIDVAKATLDLHVLSSGQTQTLPNTQAGREERQGSSDGDRRREWRRHAKVS